MNVEITFECPVCDWFIHGAIFEDMIIEVEDHLKKHSPREIAVVLLNDNMELNLPK